MQGFGHRVLPVSLLCDILKPILRRAKGTGGEVPGLGKKVGSIVLLLSSHSRLEQEGRRAGFKALTLGLPLPPRPDWEGSVQVFVLKREILS